MITSKYLDYLQEVFDNIKNNEPKNLDQAADLIVESIQSGGRFYVFGSGHSHMVAEEIYIRAGGLAYVKAILPPELMLHEMPNKSTYIERLSGYSKEILKLYKVDHKDTLMIISNSGRNSVPVEMALEAQAIGCKVIAMTSMEHTTSGSSRHESGKRLFELADVVIDTHAPKGDAAFYIDGVDTPVGPVSDFSGIALANSLIVAVVEKMKKLELETPIFKSSNLDGADEYNNELFDQYYGYWK